MAQLSKDPIVANPWLLMVAFILLMGPFALSFHLHYPDEIYYRDAALRMLDTGDYLTSYLGSGELRFKKPIFTYWAVLAGIKLFGSAELGTRIFFLLAGAGTVGLTYRLGMTASGDKRIASLGSLIMASNLVLILSSTRSIPDVLLVMTLTISAIGFSGLLQSSEQSSDKKFLWMLYLGLASAMEVKGLPALALGTVGIAYLLANPWNRISWKRLLYVPALVAAFLMASFWFVAMWQLHGSLFLDSFLADQVGIRVADRLLLVLQHGLMALLLLLLIFVPWIFFLGFKKQQLRECWNENPQFFGFVLFWGLAILGMSALTSKFYERYLLPVLPVLAIGLAWMLIRLQTSWSRRKVSIPFWVLLGLNALIWLLSLWLFVKSPTHAWGLIKLILSIGAMGYLLYVIRRWGHAPLYISLLVLLIFWNLSTVTDHASFPSPGAQFQEATKNRQGEVAYWGKLHTGSKIRLALHPQIRLVDLQQDTWNQALGMYEEVILEDRFLDQLDPDTYEIIATAREWKSASIPLLLWAKGSSDFNTLEEKHSRKFIWIQRKSLP